MRKFLIVLTLFIAVGAVGGAVMMWIDPSGFGWGGAPMLDLLRGKMPWPAVNGLPQLLAALLLIKKHPLAYQVTLACGIMLMLWIVLEWWVWGFNALSNIYFALGLVEALAAVYGRRLLYKKSS